MVDTDTDTHTDTDTDTDTDPDTDTDTDTYGNTPQIHPRYTPDTPQIHRCSIDVR